MSVLYSKKSNLRYPSSALVSHTGQGRHRARARGAVRPLTTLL